MKDYPIYDAMDVYEREANYFASQLLIDSTDFLDYASMQYTSMQIASELNIHGEFS